jgi:hypothetical protein
LFFGVSFAKFCRIVHPDLRSGSVVIDQETLPRCVANPAELFVDSGHERYEIILFGRNTKFLIGLHIKGDVILTVEQLVEAGHRGIGGRKILLCAARNNE